MTETSGCRPESDDDEEKVDDHSEALGNEEKFLQEYGIEQCSCMHKLEMLPNTAINPGLARRETHISLSCAENVL